MPARKLAALFFLGAGGLLLPNCSSDDPASGGTAGTPSGGSTATTGGSAGTATSAGTGTGGSGASSGAGSSAGGKAGSGGGGAATTGGTSAGGSASGGTSGSAAGGGGSGGGSGGSGGGSGGSGGGSGTLTLTSTHHTDGMKFADKYTCKLAGFNGSVMPDLAWSGAPAGTKSFAITFIDTTIAAKPAPNDANGYHWVVFNIPAATMSLPEEFKTLAGSTQIPAAFLGPCPNFGGGTNVDNYEFTLYALADEMITVTGTGTTGVKNAKMALEAKNLAKTTLKGTSDASPP